MAAKKPKKSRLDWIVQDETASQGERDYSPSTVGGEPSPLAHKTVTKRQSGVRPAPSGEASRDTRGISVYDFPDSPLELRFKPDSQERSQVRSQESDADEDDIEPDDFDLQVSWPTIVPGVRKCVAKSRKRIEKAAKALLQDSNFSDNDREDSEGSGGSDVEDLVFAPAETQLEDELQRNLTNEEADIPDCEDIGQFETEYNPYEHEAFERLVKNIEQDGWKPVIMAALKAEAASGSTLGASYIKQSEIWKLFSFFTMSVMPKQVIQELTHGNLVMAAKTDEQLGKTLNLYLEQSKKQPIIYARVHVSASGEAMSVKDGRVLIGWLRRYMSESKAVTEHETCQEVFYRTDREFQKWKLAWTQTGDRRSLRSLDGTRSEARVRVLTRFCDAVEARCRATDEDGVLSPPLLYIGYAARGDIRARQHEACGSSSNWLASLVQALSNILWERGKYHMHFFVICPISEEDQGEVAEMLLTRVPGAYYHNGGGFCIDIAGKSMESIHFKNLTNFERKTRWNDINTWINENTPAIENAREQERHINSSQGQNQQSESDKEKLWKYLLRSQEMYEIYQRTKNLPTSKTEKIQEAFRKTKLRWADAQKRWPEYFHEGRLKYKD